MGAVLHLDQQPLLEVHARDVLLLLLLTVREGDHFQGAGGCGRWGVVCHRAGTGIRRGPLLDGAQLSDGRLLFDDPLLGLRGGAAHRHWIERCNTKLNREMQYKTE